jgi:hypothetical protein
MNKKELIIKLKEIGIDKNHYSLKDLGLYNKDNFRLNIKKEKNRYKAFTRCWDLEARGLPYKEYNIKYFDTENEVYEEYVDYITQSSGTGLTFEDKKNNS